MSRHIIGLTGFLGVAITSSSSWAISTGPGASFQVGAFGGGHVFAEGVSLGSAGQGGSYTQPRSDAMAGLRVGAGLGPWFSAEAEFSGMDTVDKPSGRGARILGYRVNAMANFRSGRFRPFLLLGAGAMHVARTEREATQGLARDVKAEAHAGIGFNYRIIDAVAVRGDARLIQVPSKENWGLCTDFEATFGAMVRFGAGEPSTPRAPSLPDVPPSTGGPSESPSEVLVPEANVAPTPERVSANPAASAIPARSVSDLLERAKEIRFDFGGTTIQASSSAFLADLASRLLAEPDARLEIGSHVADTGNPKKELLLTTKRSEVVKAALVARGVSTDRLVAKGYGAEQPIAPSLTRTGRMRNDRIELHRVAR